MVSYSLWKNVWAESRGGPERSKNRAPPGPKTSPGINNGVPRLAWLARLALNSVVIGRRDRGGRTGRLPGGNCGRVKFPGLQMDPDSEGDYSEEYETESDTPEDAARNAEPASDLDYSDDFEASRLSSKNASARPHLDEILSQLASEKLLPRQVSNIRNEVLVMSHTLMTLSGELEENTAQDLISRGHRLEILLRQLEVDLIAGLRSQTNQTKEALRKASKVRAGGRRVEYNYRLADAELRATTAEMQKGAISQQLAETETELKKVETHLQLSQEARLNLERCTLLRDQEIAELKLRSSRIAAASGLENRKMALKAKEAEDISNRVKMQRDIDIAMLRSALDAAERKHTTAQKTRVVLQEECLRQKKKELAVWKFELARHQAEVETERATKQKRFEEVCARLTHDHEQRQDTERASLVTSRLVEKEANERQKDHLDCLQCSLYVERSAVAKDRSRLETSRSKLLTELLSLKYSPDERSDLRAQFENELDANMKQTVLRAQHTKSAIYHKQSVLARQVNAISRAALTMKIIGY
mmetsp:Transcript_23267/g.72832  ORF Transcript_23267/g.72832 Transcript_23267/m.72832 type:complete len:532 (-) Transcript_23267:271-1866(-)